MPIGGECPETKAHGYQGTLVVEFEESSRLYTAFQWYVSSFNTHIILGLPVTLSVHVLPIALPGKSPGALKM